jgi:hypothetical protein
MRSNPSSRMQVALHIPWLQRSAGLASIAVAMGGASCSDAADGHADAAPTLDVEDAGPGVHGDEAEEWMPDGAPTSDAPFFAPNGADADATAADGPGPDHSETGGIPLCLRLRDPDRPVKVLDLSQDVRSGYLTFVAADCMVRGLFAVPSATVAAWSNRLYDWNLDVWACTDHAATGFALVHSEVTDLTSADAAVLIEDYLEAATRVLRLSPPEATQMRQDLVRLGMAAITRQSDERLFSECDANDAGREAAEEGGDGLDSASADAPDAAGGSG